MSDAKTDPWMWPAILAGVAVALVLLQTLVGCGPALADVDTYPTPATLHVGQTAVIPLRITGRPAAVLASMQLELRYGDGLDVLGITGGAVPDAMEPIATVGDGTVYVVQAFDRNVLRVGELLYLRVRARAVPRGKSPIVVWQCTLEQSDGAVIPCRGLGALVEVRP